MAFISIFFGSIAESITNFYRSLMGTLVIFLVLGHLVGGLRSHGYARARLISGHTVTTGLDSAWRPAGTTFSLKPNEVRSRQVPLAKEARAGNLPISRFSAGYARIGESRLPLRRSRSGEQSSSCACSRVSHLPMRFPRRGAPFTSLMEAAVSAGINSAMTAARVRALRAARCTP